MKEVLTVVMLASFAFIGCDTGIGPSDPGNGPGVAWFNTLGSSVDIYYPADSTLVSEAFITGEAPNDMILINMILIDDGLMAIVNSISSSITFVDPGQLNIIISELQLEEGSNPYSACTDGDYLYVAGLLSASVFVIDLETMEVVDEFEGATNASGIACASGRLFVSCANWPVPGSHGTFVMDPRSGEISDTLPTPENTHLLRYFPETGMIHALSTTYTGDGAITIIDPSVPEITMTIQTGGTPFLPSICDGAFLSGDSYSSSSIYVYDETSGLIETRDAGFSINGIAALGETLYMTSPASDVVLVMKGTSWEPVDTLQAGDGPQGIVIIPER